MISKIIACTLICLLAASLCHTHEDLDAPRTQMYAGLPQAQGQLTPQSGLYTGIRPIGGCLFPGPINGGPSGVVATGGLGQYTGGEFPNRPLNGGIIGEVIIPVNPQYQPSYNSQSGGPFYPQFTNGQTFVPSNIQYGTNSQHTGGPYYIPPCTKDSDKSRSATQNEFTQPDYRADGQDVSNTAENVLGGYYLRPYSNCDRSSVRSSENEDLIPVQAIDSRSADSPILTAIGLPHLNPHFARDLNNYFHRFGYTKPLPHGGLIYSNTFSNHLHNNLH